MLNPLWVLLAQFLSQHLLIFIVKVERGRVEYRILGHHFIQDIDVEGQPFCAFQLLDQFSADGAPDSVLVVQVLDTRGAEGVSTVHKNAGDSLADIVLLGAELADVELPRLVVQIHYVGVHLGM